ncbi:DUF2577 domain-containing protein [Clostridium peptidivorans]|uniref:DUF2577 domain-containing protein n=1 Tax=Clostridium peptidivorans TaxID=100174 RepID=UPI000BE3AA39|nr:DUF2577 domain-containing protein [Clostridium peptidivorans]
MGMIDIVKKAGVDAVGAGNPVNIIFGEILSIEDLKIKIDQKLILPQEFFIIPENLTRYEIDLSHSHNYSNGSTSKELNKIVIREGLKQGDKVLLLRVQGGQQYVILDKVV